MSTIKKKNQKQNQDFAPMHSVSLPPGLIQCKSQCSDRDLCLESGRQLKGATTVCILCMFSVFICSFVPAHGYCKPVHLSAGCGHLGQGLKDRPFLVAVRYGGLAENPSCALGRMLFSLPCLFWWRISQFGFLPLNDPVHLWH